MVAFIALLALLPALAVGHPARRATGQLIQSNRSGGCLSVAGGRAAVAAGQVTDGTAVVNMACQQASMWDISPGSGSVVVSGTKYALDAGIDPHNFVAMKVWTSYPGLTQQTYVSTVTGEGRSS